VLDLLPCCFAGPYTGVNAVMKLNDKFLKQNFPTETKKVVALQNEVRELIVTRLPNLINEKVQDQGAVSLHSRAVFCI
jgi:hypothetical protein